MYASYVRTERGRRQGHCRAPTATQCGSLRAEQRVQPVLHGPLRAWMARRRAEQYRPTVADHLLCAVVLPVPRQQNVLCARRTSAGKGPW